MTLNHIPLRCISSGLMTACHIPVLLLTLDRSKGLSSESGRGGGWIAVKCFSLREVNIVRNYISYRKS